MDAGLEEAYRTIDRARFPRSEEVEGCKRSSTRLRTDIGSYNESMLEVGISRYVIALWGSPVA